MVQRFIGCLKIWTAEGKLNLNKNKILLQTKHTLCFRTHIYNPLVINLAR